MHAAGRRADENASAAQHHHQRQPLTRPAASTVAFVQPRCACFRLCSEHDVRSFHIRVPSTLRTHHSPWYTYLQKVYREEHIPLPVSLSAFEFFYLALLPVDGQCADSSQTAEVLLPSCASDVCSAWLRNEPASAAEIAEHSLRWNVREYQWHQHRARLLPKHTLRFLPRDPSESHYRGAGARLEVIRHATNRFPFSMDNGWVTYCSQGRGADPRDWVGNRTWGAGEGVQYGCWFSPSVGTGIFLDVGKALFYRDREALERALPEVRRFPLDRPHILKYRSSAANDSITTRAKDCLYANLTRARGFNTLFVLRGPWDPSSPELVVTTSGCMDATAPLPTGCAPRDVGLRTGWRADRPCMCVATHDDGLDGILNCAGTWRW